MTATDDEKLLALARKATPGPWRFYRAKLRPQFSSLAITQHERHGGALLFHRITADSVADGVVSTGEKAMTFEQELQDAINRHSQENASNTPDFILAMYLNGCLAAFNQAVQQRETWHGRDARPSAPILEKDAQSPGATR